MESKLFVGVISVFVAIVVLAGALMPVINEAANGETTIHITNEDSSTLKLQKITSNFALDLSVTIDGDSNIVVSNGNDSIVADPNESMYILATDSAAIYYDQGDMVFIWTDDNVTSERLLTNPFTAVIADGKLTVDDGTSTDAPLPSTFMFAPSSTGQYGSFTVADLNLVPDDPVIAAGSFAGVYCYNQYSTIGDALQEYVTVSDDVLIEVIWAAAADAEDQQQSIEPFDPSQIDFDPIDFDPLDPGVHIMSVPTPTYTDGDWGYDIVTVGNVQKAKIVSYSGTGGGAITIPATVGGYDVYTIGKGMNYTVFDTTFSATDLIISNGIEKINTEAFKNCAGFTGTLTIPSSVTTIGQSSFENCTGFTGTLTIPSSVTTIESWAFTGCSGFSGTLELPPNVTTYNGVFTGCSGFTGTLTIPFGVTSIGAYTFANCSGFTGTLNIPSTVTTIQVEAFSGCTGIDSLIVESDVIPKNKSFFSTGITEVLNLSNNEWTTTSYGLNANEVRTEIDALLFLAPADVAITEGSPSAFAPLLDAIPLIIIMSILMMIVGYTMIRRSY